MNDTFTVYTPTCFCLFPSSLSQVCLTDTLLLWFGSLKCKWCILNKYLEIGTCKILHSVYRPMGGHLLARADLTLATHDIPVLCTAFEDFSSITNITI